MRSLVYQSEQPIPLQYINPWLRQKIRQKLFLQIHFEAVKEYSLSLNKRLFVKLFCTGRFNIFYLNTVKAFRKIFANTSNDLRIR